MKLIALASFAVLLAPASLFAQSLGAASKYNVFILNDFTSQGSDTEGALAVGHNADLQNYTINRLNVDGPNNNSLYVGNDLSYNSGSIHNGSYFVGGDSSFSNVGFTNSTETTTVPVEFAQAAYDVTTFSFNLANTSTNAVASTSPYNDNGLILTGNETSGAQVFNLSAQKFNNLSYIAGIANINQD